MTIWLDGVKQLSIDSGDVSFDPSCDPRFTATNIQDAVCQLAFLDHYEASFTSVFEGQTFVHNLGRMPAIKILNSTGDEVETAVRHIDDNSVSVSWAGTLTGTIICN